MWWRLGCWGSMLKFDICYNICYFLHMYKTISVTEKVYQQLNLISSRLKKPKAQVIEILVERAEESLKDGETKSLDIFNAKMKALFDSEMLSKKIQVSAKELEDSVAGLDSVDIKLY